MLPAKNDVSRLLPLVKGRVQFSANGIATYFAQEGLYQFASENWGPLKVRIIMTSNGESNQSLGVAANLGITSFSDLRGKRVLRRGAPQLMPTEAFLACGGWTWDDVQRVNPRYNAMWTVRNNKADAAYANMVSGPARKEALEVVLASSSRGFSLLGECRTVLFDPAFPTCGAAISVSNLTKAQRIPILFHHDG